MDCPECGADMESDGASGNQVNRGASGAVRRTPVAVSWDTCPECGTVRDPDGRVHPGGERE